LTQVAFDNDDLVIVFNISNGPSINGTKIIVFLDGDVYYEEGGVPHYNRTMIDIDFDNGTANDLQIRIAPSVVS